MPFEISLAAVVEKSDFFRRNDRVSRVQIRHIGRKGLTLETATGYRYAFSRRAQKKKKTFCTVVKIFISKFNLKLGRKYQRLFSFLLRARPRHEIWNRVIKHALFFLYPTRVGRLNNFV